MEQRTDDRLLWSIVFGFCSLLLFVLTAACLGMAVMFSWKAWKSGSVVDGVLAFGLVVMAGVLAFQTKEAWQWARIKK